MFVSLLILFAIGVVAIGIQTVPSNTQWLIVFMGRRLPIRLEEGLNWLPRWFFSKIPVSMLEYRIDVLVKLRRYAKPDDTAPTQESAHQDVETILVPDGNGEGAVFVHVSNVSVQVRVIGKETGWPDGWLKFMRFFGWKRGNALYEYTSISKAEIDERIISATLRHLRQVIGDYPYQKIVHLNVKLDGALVSVEERSNTRREIDARITEALNNEIRSWGMVATQVPIGDIDPDPSITQALQALSAANLNKQRMIIDMSAVVTKVDMMFKATNTTPTHEQWLQAYVIEAGLANQGLAASHGLLSAEWLQKLKGIIPAIPSLTPTPSEKAA